MKRTLMSIVAVLLLAVGPACFAQVSTSAVARAPARMDVLQVEAPGVAPSPLRVRVLLPAGYRSDAPTGYPVLYVNDGQDMEAVALRETLAALIADGSVRPVIAVAIDMPPDRMAAYGLSDRAAGRSVVAQTRFGPVGANAQAYSEWIVKTLVPLIDARYRTRRAPDARTMLGWSLGALNAFNLGWNYPEVFGRVGAFSPSFWVPGDSSTPDTSQRTRLVQRMVDRSASRPELKLFFAVGDKEETNDRDHDGVIDAVDDVHDLIDGWQVSGQLVAKGLRQIGYRVDLDPAARATHDAVALYALQGGEHNQKSWALMLPVFLRWDSAGDASPPHARERRRRHEEDGIHRGRRIVHVHTTR